MNGAYGERRYSSHSFLTSALEEDEWSASRPSRNLPLEKGPPPRFPFLQKGGWATESVWMQSLEDKPPACVGDRTAAV
jgi:hypothetical protein